MTAEITPAEREAARLGRHLLCDVRHERFADAFAKLTSIRELGDRPLVDLLGAYAVLAAAMLPVTAEPDGAGNAASVWYGLAVVDEFGRPVDPAELDGADRDDLWAKRVVVAFANKDFGTVAALMRLVQPGGAMFLAAMASINPLTMRRCDCPHCAD